ncbi:MAG: protein kinase [Propionibacteriaceae bacterium]|jgi:hypothetical protein|nr:protein kinase [Propionibacteriaceae bacterium]
MAPWTNPWEPAVDDLAQFQQAYQQSLDGEVAATWPPEWVATYELESCLRAGEGKEVYLARDRRNRERVVLRVTQAGSAESADAEWAILSRLNHPGVPVGYGSCVYRGRSFIAREFFPGEALDQVVARRVLTPAQAIAVGRQLCGLLEYLHGQDPPVIHRDIKPQNIIWRPDGTIGLTDFGIARVYKPGVDSDTHYAGTLPYAPPEQYGYAQSTAQTDIYALGIVLIYLLTGSPDRRNLETRISDAGLRQVVAKCIAFDPASRFQSAAQVGKRLSQVKGRTFRIAAVAAAAVVALGGLGAGGYLFLNQGLPGDPPGGAASTGGTAPTSTGGYSPAVATVGYLGEGNYPGNISNSGMAVATDSEIYVANAAGIVALDTGGRFLRVVSPDTGAQGLNFYEGRLYYLDRGVKRVNPDGSDLVTLVPEMVSSGGLPAILPSEMLWISGGRLWFQNGYDSLHLYSAAMDGSDIKAEHGEDVFYQGVSGGFEIYDSTDYELYASDLAAQTTRQITEGATHWPAFWDGWIYFSEGNAFYKVLSDGTEKTLLHAKSFDFTVATERGIFAVSSADESLQYLPFDGGTSYLVVQGRTGFFNVAGNWVVYYTDVNSMGELRMVHTDGTHDQLVPTS